MTDVVSIRPLDSSADRDCLHCSDCQVGVDRGLGTALSRLTGMR